MPLKCFNGLNLILDGKFRREFELKMVLVGYRSQKRKGQEDMTTQQQQQQQQVL